MTSEIEAIRERLQVLVREMQGIELESTDISEGFRDLVKFARTAMGLCVKHLDRMGALDPKL